MISLNSLVIYPPGPQARKLLVDAQVMLERLVAELEGRAVVGMFDCRSDGDDVIVNDLTSTETLYMLRQQVLYTLHYCIIYQVLYTVL